MLTFKKYSMKQHCVLILICQDSWFPSDLVKSSYSIQLAHSSLLNVEEVIERRKKKEMFDITVIKRFEFIITLNTHNFLFYYSHSTQWKLSLPLNFLLTFFNFENLQQLQWQQQQQQKNTTYSLSKDMILSFNAKHKVYIVKMHSWCLALFS